MALQDDLFALERRFWMEGEGFFAEALASEARLVFADPVGALDREEAVTTIGGAPRWSSVDMAPLQCRALSDDAALIVYEAEGRRDGQAHPYRTLAGTLYVRENGDWKLAFHQQTPHAPE